MYLINILLLFPHSSTLQHQTQSRLKSTSKRETGFHLHDPPTHPQGWSRLITTIIRKSTFSYWYRIQLEKV